MNRFDMNTNQRSTKAPFVSIVAVFAALVLFGLFALTLQVSIWAFIGSIAALVVVLFIGVWLYRMGSEAWIKVAAMRLEARRADQDYDFKCRELAFKYRKSLPEPTEQKIERLWKPELEKYRNAAINILALTCDVIGDDTNTLISHNRAVELNNPILKSGSVFQTGLDFLTGNSLVRVIMHGERHEGTMINDGLTARQLLEILTPRSIETTK